MESILDYVVSGTIFFLPVFVANLIVYIIYSFLGSGIAFDSASHRRIIGDSRTYNGALAYLFTSLLVGILQGRALQALYLGAGGHFGCVINSMIKRALGFERGRDFYPLDQTDYLLGAYLFCFTAYGTTPKLLIGAIGVSLIVHSAINLFVRKRWEEVIGMRDGKADR